MKAAIITVAGVSSRFNKGIHMDEHKLKAIYHEDNEQDTLIYHMLDKLDDSDRIIIVAGYKQEELKEYLYTVLPKATTDKISLVVNHHYEDWSSGYSLYLGIKEAFRYHPDSIIFAEGDLDVDDETFKDINNSKKSVITCNSNIIYSNKAVIGYRGADGRFRYSFSTSHGLACVDEPFSMLFNSGQVWKFSNMTALKEACESFEKVKENGTNLVIISGFFAKEDPENVEFKEFKHWVNCNTREDYHQILSGWEAIK